VEERRLRFSDSEIDENRSAVGPNDHVARLDVPMPNAALMAVRERPAELAHKLDDFVYVQVAGVLTNRAPFEMLHDEEGAAVGEDAVVK